jgi:hypothetical protein
MIDRLVVYLLLAACFFFAAIILVELASSRTDGEAMTVASPRPEAVPSMRRQPSTRLDELLATTLARPLFSSTRRPPQSAASDGATGTDLADARLTGIVTAPGRNIAIFAVNGAKALSLTEGETVSGWRIEAITPREVALSGPGGTKSFQPKADPSLAPPLGAPPAITAPARPPIPPAAAAAGLPRPGVPPGIPAPPPRPRR